MNQELKPGSHIHFMGIGGFGINPIARLLHDLGYKVSGCDMVDGPLLPALRDKGIKIEIGHSSNHIGWFKPDALVISSAIASENREVWEATQAGIPVYKRSDILCELMRDRIGIGIAGTHGKTTTTAMMAFAFQHAGLDPSYIIGGMVKGISENARAGNGDTFVIEADEYDRMFLGLCPKIGVVTSLEMDHPDMFESVADIQRLFIDFVSILPADGLLVASHDSELVRKIADSRTQMINLPTVTYGLIGGDWTVDEILPNQHGGVDFTALFKSEALLRLSLKVPGKHNVENALAVIAVAHHLEADMDKIAAGLAAFEGVERRFEVKGVMQDVVVIDDYAHHPTAIRATLEAASVRYPTQSIWAVWQPHTYSRTKTLMDEFAMAFMDAHHVIITDIYRSRDIDTFGITSSDIVDKMRYHGDVQHIPEIDDVTAFLALNVRPNDVVIVMSAGDATRITDDLLKELSGE